MNSLFKCGKISVAACFLASATFAQSKSEQQSVFLAYYVNNAIEECLSAIETGDLNTSQIRSYGYRKNKKRFERSIFPTGAAGTQPAEIIFEFSSARKACEINISPAKIDDTVLTQNLQEVMFRNDYKPLDGARSKKMTFFKNNSKVDVKSKSTSNGSMIILKRLK